MSVVLLTGLSGSGKSSIARLTAKQLMSRFGFYNFVLLDGDEARGTFSKDLGFSNEDRLRILLEIEEKAMRLTHLSEKLNFTAQETSRHLLRLGYEKLIKKEVNWLYHLTPYEEYSMRLLSGFEFL